MRCAWADRPVHPHPGHRRLASATSGRILCEGGRGRGHCEGPHPPEPPTPAPTDPAPPPGVAPQVTPKEEDVLETLQLLAGRLDHPQPSITPLPGLGFFTHPDHPLWHVEQALRYGCK